MTQKDLYNKIQETFELLDKSGKADGIVLRKTSNVESVLAINIVRNQAYFNINGFESNNGEITYYLEHSFGLPLRTNRKSLIEESVGQIKTLGYVS